MTAGQIAPPGVAPASGVGGMGSQDLSPTPRTGPPQVPTSQSPALQARRAIGASARLSSTALVATMMEDADMSSAAHSGRSMIPNSG